MNQRDFKLHLAVRLEEMRREEVEAEHATKEKPARATASSKTGPPPSKGSSSSSLRSKKTAKKPVVSEGPKITLKVRRK